jgi:hypothetical protein
LNGEVVDYGFYAYDLGGVGRRERADGFAADGAVQGGDLFLDRRLDGLAADGAVTCDSTLESCGEGGIISGGRWRGALAAGEGKDQGEGADGYDGARDSDFLHGVHTSPLLWRRPLCEHSKSITWELDQRVRHKDSSSMKLVILTEWIDGSDISSAV